MPRKPTPPSEPNHASPAHLRRHRQMTEFISRHLSLAPDAAPGGISLYLAHSGTGLGRLLAGRREGTAAPYWAYCWAGGLALAHYFAARPEVVAGKRVLDLGSGGGVVAIAAAKAGASHVLAAEIDPYGCSALSLNAGANGVGLTILHDDLLPHQPPDVDLVALGDLFYEAALALAVTAFLDRCLGLGITVLIGDPGRRHLPLGRLERLADYPVRDFGHSEARGGTSSVFRLIA